MLRSSRMRLATAAAAAIIGVVAAPVPPSSADFSGAHLMLTPGGYAASRSAASIPGQIIPGPLLYHNGPVMRAGSTTYSIFWQPPGTFMSATYRTLINRYFTDVGGSTLYNNDTQYHGRNGNIVNSSTFGGTWTDTAPYPATQITDAQIQAEVSKAMQANGWTGGLTHDFFVYLAKGQDTCLQPGVCFLHPGVFCGYHGFFQSGGATVLYANMPYVGTVLNNCGPEAVGAGQGPNGDPDADAEINVNSHEHMETVTDPLTTFKSPTGAWYDRQTNEIGDKCAYDFGTLGQDGGNITMNGNRYIVQLEWSNAINNCSLGS